MILLLIDLYKMENTVACLNIVKIEPNFWSLLYHDSIIKTSCSREQYTSHMRTDIFIELKKEMKVINCDILTRFWETFSGILKGVCYLFFGFFVQLFDHFIVVRDYSVGRFMLSRYHGGQGKDAFY